MAIIEHRMTLLLSAQSKTKLTELCRRAGVSQCAFLRQLIDRAALMELHLQPTCVDGRRCLCSQMHGNPQQAPSHPDSYMQKP